MRSTVCCGGHEVTGEEAATRGRKRWLEFNRRGAAFACGFRQPSFPSLPLRSPSVAHDAFRLSCSPPTGTRLLIDSDRLVLCSLAVSVIAIAAVVVTGRAGAPAPSCVRLGCPSSCPCAATRSSSQQQMEVGQVSARRACPFWTNSVPTIAASLLRCCVLSRSQPRAKATSHPHYPPAASLLWPRRTVRVVLGASLDLQNLPVSQWQAGLFGRGHLPQIDHA